MGSINKKSKREKVSFTVDKEIVDIYRSLAKAKNDFNKTTAFTLSIMLREALMRDSKRQAEVLKKGNEKIAAKNNPAENTSTENIPDETASSTSDQQVDPQWSYKQE